jgi:oxysterol-binding protein-related protein 8
MLTCQGVKKPLNPILGEHFTCKWKFEDGSESLYLSEQVSHHPPMSAYFYMNPEHHIRIDGLLKPRSKFLGNRLAHFFMRLLTFSVLEPSWKAEPFLLCSIATMKNTS